MCFYALGNAMGDMDLCLGWGDWSAREGVGVFAFWGFKVSDLLHTSGEFFGIMTIGVDPCS